MPSFPERTNRRKERGDIEVFLALIGGNDFFDHSYFIFLTLLDVVGCSFNEDV